MNRSHSTIYRICLLAVVILTIAGGIFYYVNYVENQTTVTEGTLVKRKGKECKAVMEGFEDETAKEPAGWTIQNSAEEQTGMGETAVESFRPFENPVKCA
ncbi:hypothetical protein E5329_18030 [Petralouisia muris]|uniref:Uncharacterized protein n=1 Tax=Petralouisia muris TaxID=3032872 RepID=A0AC61RSF6_9FIRM|nr:hypothetical protein [Petralouisia muris]TGY93570.1 hypothetical protein E5329_18030 [Petralouisia muris]